MPFKRFRRNQEPEPVRPQFLAPARGTSGDASPIGDPVTILSQALLDSQQALTAAKAEATRWKGHADSFAKDLREALGDLVDCSHDLDGAYRERAQLLSWITALHPATSVITQSPDVDEDGWQLLYLVAGGWQMSWHIHPRDAELFRHVTVVDVTDVRAQWDGHGTEQKYERIHNHVRLLALDELGSADGSMTGVTAEVRSA